MPELDFTNVLKLAVLALLAAACIWRLFSVKPKRPAAGPPYRCSFEGTQPAEEWGELVARFEPTISAIAGAALLLACALLFVVGGVMMGHVLFFLYALPLAAAALPLIMYGTVRVLVFENGVLKKNIRAEEFYPFAELDAVELEKLTGAFNHIAYAYVFTKAGQPVLRMHARRYPGVHAIERVLDDLGYEGEWEEEAR